MNIRPLTPADFATCQAIGRQLPPDQPPSPATLDFLARNQQAFVAEVGGEVVGYIAYLILWNDTGFLQFLRVAPEFQGQGIGRALVQHAEANLKAKGATSVISTALKENKNSIAFHHKLNFTECGHIDFDPSDQELVFQKKLS